MSRVYEWASQGRWSQLECWRCEGRNQRVKPAHESSDGRERFWYANGTDSVCGLCRCEIEAEEQQIADEMAAMQASDEHAEQEEV